LLLALFSGDRREGEGGRRRRGRRRKEEEGGRRRVAASLFNVRRVSHARLHDQADTATALNTASKVVIDTEAHQIAPSTLSHQHPERQKEEE